MFKKKTVFVLGAGASWHYGYPTGEGLIDRVYAMADRLSAHCTYRVEFAFARALVPRLVGERARGADAAWNGIKQQCETLKERLRTVRPLVIDYFLAQNATLRSIGKLLIAAVILEREAAWLKIRGNENRRLRNSSSNDRDYLIGHKDDWYRFIVHKLLYGCKESSDLFSNNVHFVTFNYDASLEFHLAQALLPIDMLEDAHVDKFLAEDRIAHAYGCVHEGIPDEGDAVDLVTAQTLGERPTNRNDIFFQKRMEFLDQCLDAAERLRTIDPHDKNNDASQLALADKWISDAEVIYILGYGFDENNNERIGLNGLGIGRSERKSIAFTNLGDVNTINKKVGSLFLNSPNYFVQQPIYSSTLYVEKSVRNVYDAFEMDFDALEAR